MVTDFGGIYTDIPPPVATPQLAPRDVFCYSINFFSKKMRFRTAMAGIHSNMSKKLGTNSQVHIV